MIYEEIHNPMYTGEVNTHVLFSTKCGNEIEVYNFFGVLIAIFRLREKLPSLESYKL